MNYIITADDFGMSKSTNKTILIGIELGVISSTNIMVNMPYLDDCSELFNTPKLFVGIHWNLTAGAPISNPSNIASLVDAKGHFYDFKTLKRKAYSGEIEHEHVRIELKAQLEEYIRRYGKPDYWNTHNHTQMLIPLFSDFVSVAEEYNVLNMRNNHKISANCSYEFIIKNIFIDCLYVIARKKHMKMSKGLLSFNDRNSRFDLGSYKIRKKGVVEIMIHVAEECDSVFFGNMKEERIKQRAFYFSDQFVKNMADKIVFKN